MQNSGCCEVDYEVLGVVSETPNIWWTKGVKVSDIAWLPFFLLPVPEFCSYRK